MRKNLSYYAWFVWFIAALFYALEFLQRVSPGTMVQPLMHAFHFRAETLGFVISLYFYAYAIFQIPSGLIIDRLGVRWPLIFAAMAVSLGTLLFAMVHHIWILAFARSLVGAGSAFAFVGCLQIARNYFSEKVFPVIVGLTNSLGILGALLGEEPLTHYMQQLGWRDGLLTTAWLGLLVVLLLFLFLPRKKLLLSRCYCESWLVDLVTVVREKRSWIVGIYAGLMVAPVIAFAELWALEFLKARYTVSSDHAALINSLIFVGIAIGGPLNGWLSRFFKQKKWLMGFGNFFALLILIAILLGVVTAWLLPFLFLVLGLCLSSMLLTFSICTALHPSEFSATAIAFNNMIIMVIGALFQPFIGELVDLLSGASFLPHPFALALSCLPIALLGNLVLLWFVPGRYTYRPVES